jgi:hypothetical protein
LYVGKRPISKRDRVGIRKFGVSAFGARSWKVDLGVRARRRKAGGFATQVPGATIEQRSGRMEGESDWLHAGVASSWNCATARTNG